jgi:hypothetical protein
MKTREAIRHIFDAAFAVLIDVLVVRTQIQRVGQQTISTALIGREPQLVSTSSRSERAI